MFFSLLSAYIPLDDKWKFMDRTRIYFVLQIKIGTQMTQINNCTAWI